MSTIVETQRGAAEAYALAILQHGPRTLSLLDREPLSPTLGCMDRTFWAWKFTDFPGARFQEGLCALAFLYSTPFNENPYYANQRLLGWIDGGLRFWSSIQHRDGSFDEAYPFERSLAATAFTGFYVSEALERVREHLPASTVALTQQSLARAGDWLGRNDETHGFLSNHLAAAAAALYHVFRITGEPAHERRSRYFRDRILGQQSSEGWYSEYGGADPGYQSHGTFYLERLCGLSGDSELDDSLRKSTAFLAHFVHPDGSLGGEYASRNTQTYYPAAFEMRAARDPAAAWIAETLRSSALSSAAAGLQAVDAYNYFPMLNNFVFAYGARVSEESPGEVAEPSAGEGLVWFPQAGIARMRTRAYDAYVGTAKGGVVKVFDRNAGRLVCNDCGYLGRTKRGQLATTQYEARTRSVSANEQQIEVGGSVAVLSKVVMRPFRFMAFRVFSLSIGRFAGAGRWLKRQLVQVLIYRKRTLDISFLRRVTFTSDAVTIEDELRGAGADQLSSFGWREVFTTIHMGSSRYFISNELEPSRADGDMSTIEPQQIATGIHLQRIVHVG